MNSDAKTPRREFLRRGGAIAVAGYAFPTILSGRALGGPDVAPASERVRVGFIGTGLQAFQLPLIAGKSCEHDNWDMAGTFIRFHALT